ncbi:hypothetical protein BU23DRAFT_460255, partial [Bimuria novae-zelandiae CBS 107.79]
IILFTLLPNADPIANNRIRTIINPKYRAIIEARRRKGQRIILGDMYPNVTKDSLGPNRTHPINIGYQGMALVWYEAVVEVEGKGMLRPLGVCT